MSSSNQVLAFVPAATCHAQTGSQGSSFLGSRASSVRTCAQRKPQAVRRTFEVTAMAQDPPKKKGLFGNLGDMAQLASQWKQMQQTAEQLQKSLDADEIIGSGKDGLAKMVVSGRQEPKRVELDPKIMELGHEGVQAAVEEAWKDAYTKSLNHMKDKMQAVAANVMGGAPPPS